MKRVILFVVATMLLAAAVHVATVWALPRFIMSKAMEKIGGHVGVNELVNQAPPTDKSRAVVRPSPDLAYSICVLDLSKTPVRITVPLTAPYTSVALYGSNTDNYFVRNDREAGGKDLDVVVVGPGMAKSASVPAGVSVIEAPSARGIMLVRRVVESEAALPALDEIRKKGSCAPFNG